MSVWWSNLAIIEKVFLIIALPSTLILLIQMIALMFGVGDADFEADSDDPGLGDIADSGLQIFTIRGVITFFAVTGWVGFSLSSYGLGNIVSVIGSVLCGIASMFGVAKLIQLMLRLQDDGTIDINFAKGQLANVYLTVPAAGKGTGKVMVTIGERLCELEAVTNDPEPIKTGSVTKVVDIVNGTLVVERV